MTATGAGGMALHDTVAAAFVRAREALRPHDRAHADARLAAWLDDVERDMAAVLAPHLETFIADEGIPAEARATMATVAAPEHAAQVGLLFAAVGALAYPLISATVAAPANAIQQASFSHDPNVALSPAELALGRLRHTLGTLDAVAESAKSGIDAQRLDILTKNTGDSIPIQEALLLYRRRKIDRARLTVAIEQSRTRDEWVPEIIELQYAPPGAGEVIAGRLKSHLDDATATRMLAEAGIDPANYPWMLATAGRPPGIEQMLHLWNRDAATEADVDQAVAQSDINPSYLKFVKELRWYVPPVRSVMAMLRAGAITDPQATVLFTENGVRAQDIPGYLAEAHASKSGAIKELSQAQVTRLYGAKFITRAEATTRLAALRYDAAEIALFLDFADEAQHERYVNAVVTRIHAKYTTYKLDEAHARTALAADQIPAAAVDDYIKLWNIERDASVHVLTSASIVAAARRQIITPLQTRTRLTAIGVQAGDIEIVVANGFPPTSGRAEILAMAQAVVDGAATWPPPGAPAPKPKNLTRADLVNLWHAKQLTTTELRADLIALGYSGTEADQIIALDGPQ